MNSESIQDVSNPGSCPCSLTPTFIPVEICEESGGTMNNTTYFFKMNLNISQSFIPEHERKSSASQNCHYVKLPFDLCLNCSFNSAYYLFQAFSFCRCFSSREDVMRPHGRFCVVSDTMMTWTFIRTFLCLCEICHLLLTPSLHQVLLLSTALTSYVSPVSPAHIMFHLLALQTSLSGIKHTDSGWYKFRLSTPQVIGEFKSTATVGTLTQGHRMMADPALFISNDKYMHSILYSFLYMFYAD